SLSHRCPPQIHTLSLHDALPISVTAIVGPTAREGAAARSTRLPASFQDDDTVSLSLIERSDDETLSDFARFMQLLTTPEIAQRRSEEHTSELQSRGNLVCRLLLE